MHRIDGPGATVDNKFTEGDPVGGVQATVVTDDFMNDVQEELISILAAAGVTPVKGTQNQVLNSIAKLLQSQKLTAFPTTGTATALALTPSPAIDAYASDLRFRVKFNVASGLNPTLNVSTKGAKFLKQYDSSGAKVAAVFVVNQISEVEYDGTDFVLVDPLPVSTSNLVGCIGAAKNLKVSTTGLSSAVTVSADEIVVESSSNTYLTLRSVSVAPAFSSGNGANGIDVGGANSQTANAWYYVWVIYNGTTAAGLLSLSDTAPTMPSGYTHKALVGCIRTDSTANKYPLGYVQSGRRWQWKVAPATNLTATPVLSSGVIGNPVTGAYTAVSLANFVPPITARVCFAGLSAGASQAVAPSANYGPSNGSTNAPPFCTSAGSTNNNIAQGELALEVMSLYVAADAASCRVYITGGEYNL